MINRIFKIFLIIVLFGIYIQNIFAFDYILGVENENKILENTSKIIDLDVLDNEKELIKKLKQKNRFLIGYINAGAIENYRDDYKIFPKNVIGKAYPGWEDERFLDIKNYQKFENFFLKYLDLAKQNGFDAIEFDNIDTFNNFEETGFKISKDDELNYLNFLEKQAHKRGLKIFQKNASKLVGDLVENFDGAIVEDGFYENIINYFSVYISNNKSVYNIEYTDNISKEKFLKDICPKSQKLGIISILKNRDLDEFILECPIKKVENKNLALEKKLKVKLDKIILKINKKYSSKKRRILYRKIIHKIKILKQNKKYKKKLFLLKIIEKRFVLELNTLNSKKLIPKKDKIYFGAFQEFGGGETEVSKGKLENFEELIGKKPAWAYFSQDFAEEGIIFPKQSVEKIIDYGEIPFIRLMPSMVYEHNKKIYNLKAISSGKYDKELRIWAKEAKKINSPIFLDFAVEMNGNWFFYSGNPELYKKTYKHIIDIFREENVNNVTWFFHVNMQSFPNSSNNKPKNYYPGDKYIDWLGFSLYGTQNPIEENIDFKEELIQNYKDILDISDKKPIALLEFGVADFNLHYKKEIWLKNTFETILDNPYIKFSAISIWSEKWEEKDYYSDLRIQSSKKSLEVYKKYLSKNIFENNLLFSK